MTKADLIRQAINLIDEAQNLVQSAVEDTRSEPNFNAYGKYGFDQLLGNGNPYDESLFSLIKEIGDESADDDEEEEYTFSDTPEPFFGKKEGI